MEHTNKKRNYTDTELRQFDRELEPYKEIGPITGNLVLLHQGWIKYMAEKKAITPIEDGRYAVLVHETETGGIDSSTYDELVHKFSQWSLWQGRMKYASDKKVEAYQQ